MDKSIKEELLRIKAQALIEAKAIVEEFKSVGIVPEVTLTSMEDIISRTISLMGPKCIIPRDYIIEGLTTVMEVVEISEDELVSYMELISFNMEDLIDYSNALEVEGKYSTHYKFSKLTNKITCEINEKAIEKLN